MTLLMLVSQLLPLLAFIIIDALVKDVRVAIISAVALAIGQFIFIFIRQHQVDWFILIDVLLITALGGLAIVLKNELFFKTKPAIVEALMIGFMLFLILAKDQFLLGYLGRMVPPGKVLQPEALAVMKTMLAWMCGYVLLHIVAVLYTAFFASRQVWAFVAGPGFYLAFIPVMAVILVKTAKRKWKKRKAIAQADGSQL